MRIDTAGWKRYALADIGFINFHGQRLNKADRIEGQIPFLTAGRERRGLAMFIGNDRPTYTEPISVDMFGNCFYQPFDCAGDDNVYFFVNDAISSYSKMFIASSINCETSKLYAYVDQFRQTQADCLTVLLPSDASGEPDWAYMDAHMSRVMQEAEVSLGSLTSVDNRTNRIDSSDWAEFRIGGLFDVVKGTRLTKANMIPGDTRFIGASAANNGCTATVGNTDHVHPGNTLTVSYNGSVGETFYQDSPFLASDDVNVLYPKFEMTKHIALFLVPLIRAVGARYAFVDKWKRDDMIADAIQLPVDASGKPDWAYMDAYMSKVLANRNNALDDLKSVIGGEPS